jgi:hypothetical protein
MHMWHHVTNHLITSNDKDSNSENRIKLRVRDSGVDYLSLDLDPDLFRHVHPALRQRQPALSRLVSCNVQRARDGVILKSTTNKGGLP